MKLEKWIAYACFAGLGTLQFLWQSAFALEPLPDARIHIFSEIANRQALELVVQNLEDHAVHVTLTPGPGSSFKDLEPIELDLAASQSLTRQLRMPDCKDDIVVIHLQSRVLEANQIVKDGPAFYQIYQFRGSYAEPVTFEKAFLEKRFQVFSQDQRAKIAKVDWGGNYEAKLQLNRYSFHDHALQPDQAQQIIPVFLGSPLTMASQLSLGQLPENGLRSPSHCGADPGHCYDPNPKSPLPEIEPMNGFALREDGAASGNVHVDSSFTIRGHMSAKYNDGTFHATWGWVVTAWQYLNIGPFQFYLPLGWTYVNGDGSWSIPLASFATSSQRVFIQYQTSNRFVTLQDPSGNPYTWGDWWSLTGADTDIGYRYADLSANGDLPGIDKLYDGATLEWSKFYYNGLNALGDEPIQVTYPNSLSSGHCIQDKDSSGNTVPKYAWSCSEWANGRIWIIPAHGDPSVVQHEAAHSINSYYWKGKLPSGAGGAHSLDGCYNGGLALTEGFANFVAYWVQFNRNSSNPTASYFNRNIETYSGDNSCSSGNINEMRVAATFWDMYDVPNDGPDSTHFDGWHYVDQAYPIALYLKNGTQSQMSDYLSIVDAGDPAWYDADRALFRLNKIIN